MDGETTAMFKKIVIIGMGLMGGSLAAACRKKFPKTRIVGVTRNPGALALALKRKWIHEGTRDVLAGARDADCVVICTPVDSYLLQLEKLDRVVADRALVTDVGSVKKAIHDLVNARTWKKISFVGAHPMVGSHERGIDFASPGLYGEGMVILTRDSKTDRRSFQKAKYFWGRLSKKTVVLDPRTHDKLIAEISHLPHALAASLARSVSTRSLSLAAAGFRDTTRVAASDISVWRPIFQLNRRQLFSAMTRFEKELKHFKAVLRSDDPVALGRYLSRAQRIRQSL